MSFKTQVDIKNNAEDLQKFLNEMKTWEEEIKEKEKKLNSSSDGNRKIDSGDTPLPRNVIKVKDVSPLKKKRISAYDYGAWDKFDVDKACEDLDEKSREEKADDLPTPAIDNERTREGNSSHKEAKPTTDLRHIDEAIFEKELGNKYVKEEKWKEALECYSNAINLHSSNAVFYANRALCHIKMSNFKLAEVDSTIAVQLDKSYVKAYQRRAFARKALKQYEEAIADYEKVLEFEPNNALAASEITKINEYVKNTSITSQSKSVFDAKKLFSSGAGEKKSSSKEKSKPSTPLSSSDSKVIAKAPDKNKGSIDKDMASVQDSKELKESKFMKMLPEASIKVEPIVKAVHLRSKKPLRRIDVGESDGDLDFEKVFSCEKEVPLSKRSTEPWYEALKTSHSSPERAVESVRSWALPPVPTSYVSFESSWKSVKRNPELAYQFLKTLPGKSLKTIFGSSLETDALSEILAVLSRNCGSNKKEDDFIFDFMLFLSSVERFESLVLFMSSDDQKLVKEVCQKLAATRSPTEICRLKKLYDAS